MIKRKYPNTFVCLFIAAVSVACVLSQYVQAAPKDVAADVGRSNPFDRIEIAKRTVPAVAMAS